MCNRKLNGPKQDQLFIHAKSSLTLFCGTRQSAYVPNSEDFCGLLISVDCTSVLHTLTCFRCFIVYLTLSLCLLLASLISPEGDGKVWKYTGSTPPSLQVPEKQCTLWHKCCPPAWWSKFRLAWEALLSQPQYSHLTSAMSSYKWNRAWQAPWSYTPNELIAHK